MIIKKINRIDKKDNSSEKNLSKQEKKDEQILAEPKEPAEKRGSAGDRRRGYRRIDDRNLISRAHEEANTIREQAAKEGFEYGLNMSKEELLALTLKLAEFLNVKEKALEEVSSDIAFIAVKVAEKIIKTEVSCDETIVLNIVAEALKEVGKTESTIIIKVNPAEVEIVRESMPRIFPYAGVNTKIVVLGDDEIENGSCTVETNNGIVDARFSTQIEIIRKAFEAGL
jgi:flagellar assembly protein FliH